MPTLTITKGLPGSGKSYWAKEQVKQSKGKVKRVNKDDLRNMIDAGEWSRELEQNIVHAERCTVINLLADGFDVIVDNTHLGGDHEEYYRGLARDCEYFFDIKDFTDVPLEICIARDEARPNPVGKKVIMRMYNAALKGKSDVAQYTPPVYDPDLPFCVIVDIDGTLAHGTGRSMYDFAKVYTDAVDIAVRDLVQLHAKPDEATGIPHSYVVLLSGREETCRKETEGWLKDNNIPYDELYMRPAGDNRDDTIVKGELYDKYIAGRYNVRVIYDDRNKVVKMWREQGLKVLQVQDGNF